MAIPNIVPRNNNDGETLGTQNKKWSNVHTVDVSLNGVSLANKLADIDSNISDLNSTKANSDDVYTKTEVDNIASGKANTSDITSINTALNNKLNLSGGALSGDIRTSKKNEYFRIVAADSDADSANASRLAMITGGSSNFYLSAGNGVTASVNLIGDVNGVLTWAGKNVSCVEAIGTNYIRYTNGVQICWAAINTNTDYSFPAGFSEAPSMSFTILTYSGTVYAYACTTLTNTNFRVKARATNSATDAGAITIRYIAVGRWK